MLEEPFHQAKAVPLHQRVAERLRREVLRDLPVGVKLDSEAHLARRLGVSLATLRPALSVLAHEGLIERRHGSGTFATGRPPQPLIAVGTVTEAGTHANAFQVRLFFRLAELLIRRGYRCRSCTVPRGVLTGWRELAEDVDRGRIAGAAFVALNTDFLPIDFAGKGVPYIGPGAGLPSVGLDYRQFVHDGLRHLRERGCRKIAVMQWTDDPLNPLPSQALHDILRATMSDLSLPVQEEWIRSAVSPGLPGAGWEQFREIWAARNEKPDGLLVTDDVLFRDVALGILDSQIRVPDQLQVVVHANKDSGLTYPFPVSLLEVDVEEWAEQMVERLISLMNREPLQPRRGPIRARLVPAAPRRITGADTVATIRH